MTLILFLRKKKLSSSNRGLDLSYYCSLVLFEMAENACLAGFFRSNKETINTSKRDK